jgi:bifunctional DNA-binding transcriptional regulator/antitoxin component of YhaV-PrlF toxin-antitoxin module
MHVVGQKGQVVIEKQIREKLGAEPGWLTIQRLVDDHVEIYFVPPEHNRSLLGILWRPDMPILSADEMHDAEEAAWAAVVKAEWSDDHGE